MLRGCILFALNFELNMKETKKSEDRKTIKNKENGEGGEGAEGVRTVENKEICKIETYCFERKNENFDR